MTLNEYATLVYFWRGDNEKNAAGDGLAKWDKIPAMLEMLQSQIAIRKQGMRYAIAGVVLALEKERPGLAHGWQLKYWELYREIDGTVSFSATAPEWADFHIAQWFITHDLKCIDAILDQAANGGDSGHYASSTLHTTQAKSKPFRVALEKARAARNAAMLIH